MVAGLAPGDHACLAFDDDSGYLAPAAEFVRDGLRDNHKVLYLVDGSRWDLVEPLVAGAARGQFTLVSAADTHLRDGAFDADRTTGLLRGELVRASDEGWAALRIVGDMSWAFGMVGAEALAGYEARVNRVYAQGYAMAICLYDRRQWDRGTLAAVCMAHPHTLRAGESPLLRIRTGNGSQVLRLTGEIDLSNQAAVEAVVRELATPGPLTIDVSGVRFMDGATIGMLVRTALAVPCGLRVVGAGLAMRRLIELRAGDRAAPLHLEPSR